MRARLGESWFEWKNGKHGENPNAATGERSTDRGMGPFQCDPARKSKYYISLWRLEV
jgi:hypothetical protein